MKNEKSNQRKTFDRFTGVATGGKTGIVHAAAAAVFRRRTPTSGNAICCSNDNLLAVFTTPHDSRSRFTSCDTGQSDVISFVGRHVTCSTLLVVDIGRHLNLDATQLFLHSRRVHLFIHSFSGRTLNIYLCTCLHAVDIAT